MIKFLVLGLDGATWNLIKPWIKKGKLPTLKKIIGDGVSGDLLSSIPPVTMPSWKCYSTGKNPGKFGVYWWMNVDIQKRRFVVNNSTSFKSKEIWDYLGKNDFKCGIIGMPTTYPPKKVNGFMVSEFCPYNYNFTYPHKLEKQIKEKFNYEAVFSDFHGENPDKVLNKIKYLIKQRFEVAKFLAEKYSPDFLNLTIFHIDNVQHYYWKYMEENNKSYGHVLEDFWILIDREIRSFIHKYCDENTYIFIISDHGFTKMRALFNIAPLLLKNKWTVLTKKYQIVLILRKIGLNTEKILKIIDKLNKIPILSKIFLNRKKMVSLTLEQFIDWDRSRIISPSWGLLYINRKIFKSDEEYISFINSVKSNIEKIRDPITKERVVERVYTKDIYSGEFSSKAPDLIIQTVPGYLVIQRFDWSNVFIHEPQESGWSGVHTMNGIFVAKGPRIKKGIKIDGAKIYDIAPTILHIFGLPIPNEMDGRVLKEIFNNQ